MVQVKRAQRERWPERPRPRHPHRDQDLKGLPRAPRELRLTVTAWELELAQSSRTTQRQRVSIELYFSVLGYCTGNERLHMHMHAEIYS